MSGAYTAGWLACMAGDDGRFVNPHPFNTDLSYAWDHGFLDAMESEEGELPQPESAGYVS
jgi:hypothetical protein